MIIMKCATSGCVRAKSCYRKTADEYTNQMYFNPILNANKECVFYFNYKKY